MAYHFENIKLEKGMYGRSGRSFSQALEELDPSEHYRGTPLEGLDAFQRQLKRFDIHVKGAGSDMVEKFFHTSDSAVLFPEFVSRVVRQGMEEESILPAITATVTRFDGMDYRSIVSVPSEEDKKLADKYDFEIVDTGINTSADIEIAASDLVSKVDCLCNLTDNTVVNALQTVLDKANGAKIPVFGSEIEQVKSGCVASMGIDYYQLGIETGKMAAKVLKGEKKASEMPFETITEAGLYLNTKVAENLGITVEDDLKNSAVETYDSISEN